MENLWDESPRVQKMKKQCREEGRKEGEQECLRLQQELLKLQQESARLQQESEQECVRLQEQMQAMLEKALADQGVKARRSSLVSVICVRFPNLIEMAQQRVELFDEPEVLDLLLLQIVGAPDANTARLILNPSTQAHE